MVKRSADSRIPVVRGTLRPNSQSAEGSARVPEDHPVPRGDGRGAEAVPGGVKQRRFRAQLFGEKEKSSPQTESTRAPTNSVLGFRGGNACVVLQVSRVHKLR